METHLRKRLGELFELKCDLLLYDVTSTYFEGEMEACPMAQRGYSRDSRGDRPQVCIGLVVTEDGFPLGYEVFAGNTHDSQTVQTIIEAMEKKHGTLNRVWVMDRGMVSGSSDLIFPHDGELHFGHVPGLQQSVVDCTPEFHLHGPALAIAIPAVDKERNAVLNSPLRLPVGNFRVLLRVEAQGRSPFRVLENLIPHLRLIGLPKRAILGTDENLGANGLRLRDVGFPGKSNGLLGGL